MGGWSGGGLREWSEDWRVMLNSTQDQIKLKLKLELSLAKLKKMYYFEGESWEGV